MGSNLKNKMEIPSAWGLLKISGVHKFKFSNSNAFKFEKKIKLNASNFRK